MKPVKLTHADARSDDYVVVEWMLGNTCNYACSYCPDNLHSGTIPWLDFELVEDFLNEVHDHYVEFLGKKVYMQFTGGEPTLYPRFRDMMTKCCKLGFNTSIITNASRTIRFWEDVRNSLDRVHITYHHEQADLDHIKEVIATLDGHATIHVNLPMIPDKFDTIYDAAKDIHKNHPSVSITLKPLRKGFGSELYDYTPEQLEALRNPEIAPNADFYPRGKMVLQMSDGTEVTKKPNNLILDGDNNWSGWECSIGMELISVDMRGEVYRGICKVGGSLGNVADGDYVLPIDTVLCNKDRCSCVTDIMTTKKALT